MSEPEWVDYDVVLAIREAQLAEHGGSGGIRDQGLLESALVRPRNLYHHSAAVNLSQLAAAYAFGIAKNHPFVDGNKRTAWVVCAVFLELNGRTVSADQAIVVAMMLGAADDSMSEDQLSAWMEG